jgi:hypothetical protein
VKVALCIPHLRQVEAQFAVSLAMMTSQTARMRRDIDFACVTHSSANLADSRTRIVVNARKLGADWLLWLDADMVFPPYTLIALLARDKDVIGANCARRMVPTSPNTVACGRFVYTSPEKAKAGIVEPVDRTGLAVMLMKADVFDRIEPPWFGNLPAPDGLSFGGEDNFLFDKLKAAGIEVFVDHMVSGGIGHCHERILTNQDTIDERAAFEAAMRQA